MTRDTVGSQLSNILDMIWKNPRDGVSIVRSQIRDLSSYDWLVLAGWDTAASFGPVSGKLSLLKPNTIQISDSWGKIFIEGFLSKDDVESIERPLIIYLDVDWIVRLGDSSPNKPRRSLVRDPISLVLALQFVRDYMDSTLILPRDMRDSEILRFVNSVQLDEDYFRRLSNWFSSIDPLLQVE